MSPGTGEAGRRGIVVGVDGSDDAVNAYHWATARADRFGPVTAVAAWQSHWWSYVGAPAGPVDAERDHAEAEVGKTLTALLDRTDPAVRTDPIIVHGHAGRVLVDTAADHDLLVVGTRGRGAVADRLLGSVSCYCAAHTDVPLVVVPEGSPAERESEVILVGTDGSPGAAAALDWALRYALPVDRLVLLQAWSIPAITGYESIAVDTEAMQAVTRESAEAAAQQSCERMGVDPDRVEVRVIEGDARTVLHEAGADADLVVVGRRGHTGAAHLVLGSVTSHLVHRPPSPLAVIPPDEPAR